MFVRVLKSKHQHLEEELWTAGPIGITNRRNQGVWGSKCQQWEKELWVIGTVKLVVGERTACMCICERSQCQQLERPGRCFYFPSEFNSV